MRPTTSGQRSRPGTASGRPLPSRMRSGTSAPGRQAAFLPNHEIDVTDRPVTAGLAGIMKSGMPGRQVQDRTYFLGHLRTKEAAILGEIEKLREETKENEKESKTKGQTQNTYDELLNNIHDLGGTLADYNIALERVRSGSDHDKVLNDQMQLETTNNQLAVDMDDVFVTRQRQKKEIKSIQNEINHVYTSMEQRVQNTDPVKVQVYQKLMAQMNVLNAEAKAKKNDMEVLQAKIVDIHSLMSRGSDGELREQYKEGEKTVASLKSILSQLQKDLNLARMDPKEAHAYLLSKVKSDQQKAKELDLRIAELENEIQKLQGQQQELQENIHINTGDGCDGEILKYEAMFRYDAEKSTFLDEAQKGRSEISEEHGKLKTTIVALLEHISEGIVLSNDVLPSQERLEEFKEAVSFKAKHLESSQETMLRLQSQKQTRAQELEKINNLEVKIGVEVQQLNARTNQMKADIIRFEGLDELQERSEVTKDYLLQMSERYTRQRDSMKIMVKEASAIYEKHKFELERNETWQSLERLELCLRQQGQNIFTMQEFIDTRGRQADYERIKKNCLRISGELNALAIDTCQ